MADKLMNLMPKAGPKHINFCANFELVQKKSSCRDNIESWCKFFKS